ncbi:hypothetical protein ccbrp13_56280 [Ktedonobacteria bacterium brp13]|nr:hypothetical protein ccbrp13_56280 [Ktedonobacteria bacterium brp13]
MAIDVVFALIAVLLCSGIVVYSKFFRASRLKKMQRAMERQVRPTFIFVPSANPFDRETPHIHIQHQTKRTHSRFWFDESFDREMEMTERDSPDFDYDAIRDYLIANTELEWHIRHI